MTTRRGDSTLLQLRIIPALEDDPRVELWRSGNQWAYPRVPPVWPLRDVAPWKRASFTGPLPGNASDGSDQPCRSCGAAPKGPGNYCGECGTSLDDPEILFAARISQIVGAVAAGGSTAGTDLVALIEDYTPKGVRGKKGWREVLDFVKEDFAGLARADFIRGEPATVTPNLTLACAQDVHQAVIATGRVRPEQVQHAELLLRYAPLECGYWGPFKALVKSAPAADMPVAYAEALARLSGLDWSRPAPPSVDIEDVGFLRSFLDSASPTTLMYLARRARRDLAALADQSPDTYAQVASHMILRWDQRLSHNAFVPAYVMLGARSPLDKHSKRVVKKPDMSTRRDAHPEIWNERPELVRTIFEAVNNSVEAHTWSFQVLESLGQAPAISGNHLNLALLSTYQPLSSAAGAALSARPGAWDSLTVEHWTAIFRSDDNSDFDGILDALSTGTPRPAAIEAARQFLASGRPSSPRRLLSIAIILLSGVQPSNRHDIARAARAYVSATAEVINKSATKHEKLWLPIIKKLGVADLQRLRQKLTDRAPSSARKAIDSELLRLRFESANPWEAIDWIASADPEEATLGWKLLNRGYRIEGLLERLPQWISRRLPDPSVVERVVDALFAKASVADAPQLAKIVKKSLNRGVEPIRLAASLMKTPVGPAVLWNLMSSNAGAGLLDAAPEAVRLTGDSMSADQLRSSSPGQLRFILRYIKENPARIAGDIDFGLSAVASGSSALQTEAIKQLQANSQMAGVWLSLAESQAPKSVAAARNYVSSMRDGRAFRDAILSCLDSGVSEVRNLGAELLEKKLAQGGDRALWTALAESTDSRLEDLLAVRLGVTTSVDQAVLADFDRRILGSRRRNQRARESVKARLDAAAANSSLAMPARISALLELARGKRTGDKEWALGKLAELSLAGVAIDGLDVSLVTTGDAS